MNILNLFKKKKFRYTTAEVNEMFPSPVFSVIIPDTRGKTFVEKLKMYWDRQKNPQYIIEKDWKATIPNEVMREVFSSWVDIDGGFKLMVKAGRVVDFGSIPLIFRIFISPTGPLIREYLFHDEGYKFTRFLNHDGETCLLGLTQKNCDDMLRYVGIWSTDLTLLVTIVWKAVEKYGYIAWDNHRAGRKETR